MIVLSFNVEKGRKNGNVECFIIITAISWKLAVSCELKKDISAKILFTLSVQLKLIFFKLFCIFSVTDALLENVILRRDIICTCHFKPS